MSKNLTQCQIKCIMLSVRTKEKSPSSDQRIRGFKKENLTRRLDMQTTLAQPQQKVNLDIISGVISWPGQPAVVQLKDGRNHNTTRDVIELIVSQAKAAGYRLVRGRSVGGFDLVAPKAPEPTPVKLGDKCIYPQTWEEMERERLESQWCEMWLTRDIERIKSSRAHRNPITGHFLGGDRGGH